MYSQVCKRVSWLQLYSMVKSELETLKTKEKDQLEELNTYKDKVTGFFLFYFISRSYCYTV